MSVTLATPTAAENENGEQRFVMGRVSWDSYVKISDALEDQPGLRMIYCDGRLVFVGKSRRHEWLSECLGHLVMGTAARLGIPCEPAGEATYRLRERGAGLEGDRTFHFGANALQMRGGEDYNFGTDPPPDLAIEVEVSHSADDAMAAWDRALVPEVWRFEAASGSCSFWRRRDDGGYEEIPLSQCIPQLSSDDVVDLVRQARVSGVGPWLAQLPDWVDRVIRPRLSGTLLSTDDQTKRDE
jgi:Uma2 family endonuclease